MSHPGASDPLPRLLGWNHNSRENRLSPLSPCPVSSLQRAELLAANLEFQQNPTAPPDLSALRPQTPLPCSSCLCSIWQFPLLTCQFTAQLSNTGDSYKSRYFLCERRGQSGKSCVPGALQPQLPCAGAGRRAGLPQRSRTQHCCPMEGAAGERSGECCWERIS